MTRKVHIKNKTHKSSKNWKIGHKWFKDLANFPEDKWPMGLH